MPINLPNFILRRHQNHPGKIFFGDPLDQDRFAHDNGIQAIMEVYENILQQGLVERLSLALIRGVPVSLYKITPAGEAAVVIGLDYDPDP